MVSSGCALVLAGVCFANGWGVLWRLLGRTFVMVGVCFPGCALVLPGCALALAGVCFANGWAPQKIAKKYQNGVPNLEKTLPKALDSLPLNLIHLEDPKSSKNDTKMGPRTRALQCWAHGANHYQSTPQPLTKHTPTISKPTPNH